MQTILSDSDAENVYDDFAPFSLCGRLRPRSCSFTLSPSPLSTDFGAVSLKVKVRLSCFCFRTEASALLEILDYIYLRACCGAVLPELVVELK